MGDLPLNGSKGQTAKNKSSKKTTGKGSDAEVAVERQRADAAEAQIREMEAAPDLIARLEEGELSGLTRQRSLMEDSIKKANDLTAEMVDAKTVALMMHSAYNVAWREVQSKYGLPQDVDIDWTSGEIFRKKVIT